MNGLLGQKTPKWSILINGGEEGMHWSDSSSFSIENVTHIPPSIASYHLIASLSGYVPTNRRFSSSSSTIDKNTPKGVF